MLINPFEVLSFIPGLLVIDLLRNRFEVRFVPGLFAIDLLRANVVSLLSTSLLLTMLVDACFVCTLQGISKTQKQNISVSESNIPK